MTQLSGITLKSKVNGCPAGTRFPQRVGKTPLSNSQICCTVLFHDPKKMGNSVVDIGRYQLRHAPYKIHPNSKLFIVLLASVVMLPSLSIDSCLASLPNIGFSLHAQPAATALILSLFMAGFAVGQIFSDLCAIGWAGGPRF